MAEKIAARFQWALSTLPVGASDRLLEVGCGHGIALSLVAARLRDGTIVGIDRSPKMTAGARKRNDAAIAAGKVIVRTGTLDKVDLGPGGYDSVFAINVSLFMRNAALELERIREHLKPAGALYLFYETPSLVHSRAFLSDARSTLSRAGFVVANGPDQSLGACLIGHVE